MGDASNDESGGSQLIKKQLSYAEIEQVSRAFVASGMFGKDVDKISKAITKIMAGQELGLAPFASMRAVHVIEGNATLSANTMAGMVKSSGRYDYEVIIKETDKCVIDFYEIRRGKRVKIGSESFDESEAKAAGLLNKQNWTKYPKAMMFARCISNGVRTYCPDVFSGMLVYTPDELNARVREDGTVIDMDKDGNITNAPDPKKSTKGDKAIDADEQPAAQDDLPTTDVAEDTSEHEDDTEELTESGAEDSDTDTDVGVEEEAKHLMVVDEEMMDTTWEMFESIPFAPSYKFRFLKDVTGVLTKTSIKKDDQWRALYDRVLPIVNGDEVLDAEFLKAEPKEDA